jgi:hypothetical protein
MENCPICGSQLTEAPVSNSKGDRHDYNCPVCGLYEISGSAQSIAQFRIQKDPELASMISQAIQDRHEKESKPFVIANWIKSINSTEAILTPYEQARNLILWIGENYTSKPHEWISPSIVRMRDLIGTVQNDALNYVLGNLRQQQLMELKCEETTFGPINVRGFRLSFDGWKYHDELKRTASDSKLAFMAMPFNDPLLDRIYYEYLKPAVKQTGFELKRIDEEPPAGLIDNRLRLEISKSRFLIADLTNCNRGVYWEAGYAEGQNKPVIYTCEEAYFHKNRTHFDTNHCHTVTWLENELSKAVEDLKATIRVTLGSEALWEDPAPLESLV